MVWGMWNWYNCYIGHEDWEDEDSEYFGLQVETLCESRLFENGRTEIFGGIEWGTRIDADSLGLG